MQCGNKEGPFLRGALLRKSMLDTNKFALSLMNELDDFKEDGINIHYR